MFWSTSYSGLTVSKSGMSGETLHMLLQWALQLPCSFIIIMQEGDLAHAATASGRIVSARSISHTSLYSSESTGQRLHGMSTSPTAG